MRKLIFLSLMLLFTVFMLVSCSKSSYDIGTQEPKYTHDLVYQISTDEKVNYFVLQSSLNQTIWGDVATGFVNSQGIGKFPIGVCVSNEIFYRIIPVYPYGRGIPSQILRHTKN